jgi:hypothetical protein
VSAVFAAAVAENIYDQGIATIPSPKDLLEFMKENQYVTSYPSYV